MTLPKILVVLCALGASILMSCASHPVVVTDESSVAQTQVVALADPGIAFTQRQLFVALNNHPILLPPGGYVPDSVAQFFLDSMMADTLTGIEADSVNLPAYPRQYREYRKRVIGAVASAYYKQVVEDQVKVDSAAVLKFYDEHKADLSVKDAVEIYHIFVAPVYYRRGPDSAKYAGDNDYKIDTIAYRFTDSLYQMLNAGADFKKIAMQYSHDEQTRSRAGYAGWATRGQYRPPFDSVAFGLKKGEYCHPYRDQDGFHIIFVNNRMDSGPIPIQEPEAYEHVRTMVVETATRNRMGKVLDSLLAGFTCDFNPAIVDSIILEEPDSAWYAIINGRDTVDVLDARGPVDEYLGRRRLRVLNDGQRKTAIDLLIRRALFLEGGRTTRVDTIPEVRTQLHGLSHIAGKRILFDEWYGADWKPSDSEVAGYYATHLEKFAPAKPFTVQQIVTKDSVTAEFVRDQANSGVDFLELAQKYYVSSDTTVRSLLADLGEIGPNDVDSNFFHMAQATSIGEVSPPVKTKFGYHIIKVLGRRDPRPLSDAAPDIRVILTTQHQAEEFRKARVRLAAKYHVRYPNKYHQMFLKPIPNRTKL